MPREIYKKLINLKKGAWLRTYFFIRELNYKFLILSLYIQKCRKCLRMFKVSF